MLLKEYMQTLAAAQATGEYAGRDMILALDCTEDGSAASVQDYAFVGVHIQDVGAAISPKSEDRSYVLEGDATVKTAARRSFTITGARYVSDAFQDFVCRPEIKFGVGGAVQRNYVYFHSGTLTGETGLVTILVKNDGSAAASDPSELQVELRSVGTPRAFTYAAE